jgi:5-methylcytosine-specific restriction protein A
MAAARFVPEVTDDAVRREKARARELRGTAWWKRRIAAGVCHYCGRQVGARALTMDHIVPLIRGGRSVRGNSVPACKDCNSKKQSLLPWEWEQYVRSRGEFLDTQR